MGLFSSKKTFIESSSQLLVEETPNLIQDSIVTSVLDNRNIADDLVANYLDSLHMKGKQLRRYAKTNYTYGLPDGEINYLTPKDDLVRIVLKNELNTNVFIESNIVDIANAERFALPYLYNDFGYDDTTQVVSNPPINTDNAVSDVVYESSQFLSNTELEMTFSYSTLFGALVLDTYVQTVDVEVHSIYYHVTYYKVNGKGEFLSDRLFWFYDPSTHQYPTLDLPENIKEESQYYPIVPLREHQVNLTDAAHKDTELYKTSKRVLNFWDINFQQLGDAVHESPDINDVDHIYVMAGVDIADDHEPVLRYLHEYFSYLYLRSDVTKEDFDYWNANKEDTSPPPVNVITISDANYKMDLAYNYINYSIENEVIGDIDSIERIVSTGRRIHNEKYSYEYSEYTLKKQINSTQVEVITVFGLYHINYVYSDATVDTSLRDAFNDEDKNNFIVPININVADNLNLFHANSLMYYAIRVVYNTKITKKLKWYESGLFQFFVKVVAVVLAIYGFYVIGKAIVTAAAIGIAAVAEVVIQAVLISVAVNIAMEFLVNVIGIEGAFAIVLIAAAASAASGNPSVGSIGSYKLPTAIDMLQITNTLIDAFDTQVQEAIEDVFSEAKEFKEEAEELMEALEATDRDDFGLNPYSLNILTTSMGDYETAEEFINRTTYSDNIGILSLETPSTFVDRMLKLDIPENDIRTQTT